MTSTIYWIDDRSPGAIGTMARPRAGDWLSDEIAAWREQRVTTVVSLLEREEVRELGLDDEAPLCAGAGIEFRSFPIIDRGVPADFAGIAAECRLINDRRASGARIVVHCRAGIGRSALVAACSLVMSGYRPEDAFALIGRARGLTVPDAQDQVARVKAFARYAAERTGYA